MQSLARTTITVIVTGLVLAILIMAIVGVATAGLLILGIALIGTSALMLFRHTRDLSGKTPSWQPIIVEPRQRRQRPSPKQPQVIEGVSKVAE